MQIPHRLLEGQPHPLLFAHRGLSSRAPENTLAAFRLAADAGVPGIELDVQRCGSGELVVFHDFRLDRITGVPGAVVSTPLPRLRDLDAGSRFSSRFAGERIPLLSEVFELLGNRVCYDLEIKHGNRKDTGFARDLAALIRRFGLDGRVLVSSFNPFAVRDFRRQAPGVPAAVIYARHPGIPPLLRHGEGRFICGCRILKPQHTLVSPAGMAIERRLLRYRVLPWTVNDREEAERLLELGVSGLISDTADQLMPLAEAHRVR